MEYEINNYRTGEDKEILYGDIYESSGENSVAMCSLCGGGSDCSCGSCGICNCGSCTSCVDERLEDRAIEWI